MSTGIQLKFRYIIKGKREKLPLLGHWREIWWHAYINSSCHNAVITMTSHVTGKPEPSAKAARFKEWQAITFKCMKCSTCSCGVFHASAYWLNRIRSTNMINDREIIIFDDRGGEHVAVSDLHKFCSVCLCQRGQDRREHRGETSYWLTGWCLVNVVPMTS